jgi:hypothetical protein
MKAYQRIPKNSITYSCIDGSVVLSMEEFNLVSNHYAGQSFTMTMSDVEEFLARSAAATTQGPTPTYAEKLLQQDQQDGSLTSHENPNSTWLPYRPTHVGLPDGKAQSGAGYPISGSFTRAPQGMAGGNPPSAAGVSRDKYINSGIQVDQTVLLDSFRELASSHYSPAAEPPAVQKTFSQTRKDEGRCVGCGELLPMSAFGLGECKNCGS